MEQPSGRGRAPRAFGDAAWSPARSPAWSRSALAGLGAVVLAGGRSARFRPDFPADLGAEGDKTPAIQDKTAAIQDKNPAIQDKTRALLDGVPLLAHALRAVPTGVPCVVVGPRWPDDAGLPGAAELIWALEERRFAGPAVALAAGLEQLPDDVEDLLLLAADQPFTGSAVRVLVAQRAHPAVPDGPECWVAVDENGVRQPLLGLYQRVPLRRAVGVALEQAARTPGEPGRAPSLRSVLAGLRVREVPVAAGSTLDVDTPADLDRLRRTATEGDPGPAES